MSDDVSGLWAALSQSLFSNIDDQFIATFRAPGGANNRLAAWDPFDKTMRFFKLLLFNTALQQPDRFFAVYRALGHVDLGNPVSVSVRSCAVNVDYLLAVDEFLFLEKAVDLSTLRSVVEIGAGFGRTCHTLLAMLPGLERYTIVDLGNMLNLSKRFLSVAVPEHFHKLRFVEAGGEPAEGIGADLAMNIDSFQEMPPTAIDRYMAGIDAGCRYFYLKNPIAKYDPKSIGIAAQDPNKFHDVFSLGYCRDVIDIFDDAALAGARQKYLSLYRPAKSWRLLADQPLKLFPFYHHAIYEREARREPEAGEEKIAGKSIRMPRRAH